MPNSANHLNLSPQRKRGMRVRPLDRAIRARSSLVTYDCPLRHPPSRFRHIWVGRTGKTGVADSRSTRAQPSRSPSRLSASIENDQYRLTPTQGYKLTGRTFSSSNCLCTGYIDLKMPPPTQHAGGCRWKTSVWCQRHRARRRHARRLRACRRQRRPERRLGAPAKAKTILRDRHGSVH